MVLDGALEGRKVTNALLYACLCGKYACVEWLLDNGASVNGVPGGDFIPLHLARRSGPLVALLLARKAHVNVLNSNGRTALEEAARDAGLGAAAVKVLLDAGAVLDESTNLICERWLFSYAATANWARRASEDTIASLMVARKKPSAILKDSSPKELLLVIAKMMVPKRHFKTWRQPHVVVIGGRTGIGAEVVRGLDRELVWSTSRAEGATPQRLDLADATSREAFGELILSLVPPPRVIVVCGAASLEDGEFCGEKVSQMFETNFFGPVALAKQLRYLLRAGLTRIVFVSSRRATKKLFWKSCWAGVAEEDVAKDYINASQDVTVLLSKRYSPQAYMMSKMLLNRVAFRLSKWDPGMISCCCPGQCSTALSGWQGQRSPKEGAQIIIEVARHSNPGIFCDETTGPLGTPDMW